MSGKITGDVTRDYKFNICGQRTKAYVKIIGDIPNTRLITDFGHYKVEVALTEGENVTPNARLARLVFASHKDAIQQAHRHAKEFKVSKVGFTREDIGDMNAYLILHSLIKAWNKT